MRKICLIFLLLAFEYSTDALQSTTKAQIQLLAQIIQRLSTPPPGGAGIIPDNSLWTSLRTTAGGELMRPTLSQHLFDHHNGRVVLGAKHTRIECPSDSLFAAFPSGGHITMAMTIGQIAAWLTVNSAYINGSSVKRDGNVEFYHVSIRSFPTRPFVYDQVGRNKTNRRLAKYLVIGINVGQTLPCTVFLL